MKRIGDVAFQGLGINAEQKGSLTIENGVEEIGNAAFNSSVFSMEDLVIPDSVRVIGSQAFSCDGIEGAICIPDSVYEIGENAFSYAGSLHDDFYVVKGSAAEDYLLEQYQNCDIHYLYEPAERPPLKVKYLNFNTDTINVELNSTVRISDYIASTEAADDFDVQIDDENIAIYDDATGRIVGLEPG